MRIASLLASATEMVYALGAGDRLVAVSHECDHPPEAATKPRLSRPLFQAEGLPSAEIDRGLRQALVEHGRAYEIDEAALARVKPTLVLTQAVCEVCAVSVTLADRVADAIHPRPRVLSLDAHTVTDILDAIVEVGAAVGEPGSAGALVRDIGERLDRVRRCVEGRPPPRVLAVEWFDPIFAPGHWVPEMFAMAGGQLLLGTPGAPSRVVDREAVEGLDPDVVVLMPCGFDLVAARREARRYHEMIRELAPRALATGRVHVVDGSAFFSRSGPRFVTGVEILGRLLHPDARSEVKLAGRVETLGEVPMGRESAD